MEDERFMPEILYYECLYDKFCRDFKDEYNKINGWTKVCQKFEMSALEAEKKFKLLRNDFTRCQKRMKSLPSGSGRDAAVQAKKYESFQWLLLYVDHQKTTANFPQ